MKFFRSFTLVQFCLTKYITQLFTVPPESNVNIAFSQAVAGFKICVRRLFFL